jgi:hypothetical protein
MMLNKIALKSSLHIFCVLLVYTSCLPLPSTEKKGALSFVDKEKERALALLCNGALSEKVRRLTKNQAENTLTAMFDTATYDSSVDPLELEDSIPTIGSSYDPNSLVLNSIQFEKLLKQLELISKRAAESDQFPLVSQCRNSFTRTCAEKVFSDLALKTWRRPAAASEISTYLDSATSLYEEGLTGTQLMTFTLTYLLTSPNMWFRTEMGGINQPESSSMTPYEIASLLSYSLWNSPPDQRLLNLALSKDLSKKTTIETEISRMLEDYRSKETIKLFVLDFLKVNQIDKVIKDPGVYTITTSERQNLKDSFSKSVLNRINRSINYIDFFTSPNEIAINSDVALFFNLESTDYTDSFINEDFPVSERPGLLTHPAYLMVHSDEASSGIVKRGVFTIEQLLCLQIPSPPDDISSVSEEALRGVDLSKLSSREELVVSHSGQPRCNTCHQYIDPAGFGLENYDTLGRYRESERDGIPINSSGHIKGIGSSIKFSDNKDYVDGVIGSSQFKQCLSDRYYHHIFGERKSLYAQCQIKNISKKIRATMTIQEITKAIILNEIKDLDDRV